jgi:hypothetical protein
MQEQIALLRRYIAETCHRMLHESTDVQPYPFLVPGSVYSDMLWDWDSWLCSVALLQALQEPGVSVTRTELLEHMKGCIRNYLHYQAPDGYMPICIDRWLMRACDEMRQKGDEVNQCKPVLAQFAALISREEGDVEWIREGFTGLQRFHRHYEDAYLHTATGLYYWHSDMATGVDNEPAFFGRPRNSCAAIFLNALMVRELEAGASLAQRLGLEADSAAYRAKCDTLVAAIRRYMWDERDGFYYNVDLQCKIEPVFPGLHMNQKTIWPCLPVRIQGWTGFIAMWAGIATPAQAERMVREHLLNPTAFASVGGVRSLAANEPMYNLEATNNPSNWLGGIWLIANYMAFRGLRTYGYVAEAADIYHKTVNLLAKDVAACGAMHEYYVPETGEPIVNQGFMNWNYLVMNMMAEMEGDRTPVNEWQPEGSS